MKFRAPRSASARAIWLVGILAAISCSVGCDRGVGQRPNVLLVVVDTLRKDHLGCYGYHRNTSPNIDRLAEVAVRYDNAISQAPWTSPSLGSLFTSLYPSAIGIEDVQFALDDELIVLSEVLRDNGYTTGAVVSHTYCSSRWNFSQGFDFFDEKNIYTQISSPGVTRAALDFLKRHREGPFFLFLHYFDPHDAYLVHPGFEFSTGRPYEGPVKGRLNASMLRALPPELRPEDVDEIVRRYDSEIAFTDKHVGKVLDRLRLLELFDDALIIVTADHGEEFKDHGGLRHGYTLYQELINVPLIVKYPGLGAGVVKDTVALLDLYPTVLGAASLSVDHEIEGIPLVPFHSAAREGPRTVFSETSRYGKSVLRAAVSGPLKIIRDLNGDALETYDLSTDPGERHDLSDQQVAGFEPLLLAQENWLREMAASSRPGREIELTPEDIERLKSLGYIDDEGDDKPPDLSEPDPE
jgi:arylsulfatase A-like enzyme